MSIYEVKEILGHTDIRTTMRYSHLEMQSVFLKQKAVIEQLERNRTAIPPVESI
jgi:site-specific recombinase XerD